MKISAEAQKGLATRRAAIACKAKQCKMYPLDDGYREELSRLRADYAEANIEAHVNAVVASSPPLSPEQQQRLRTLLGGGQ